MKKFLSLYILVLLIFSCDQVNLWEEDNIIAVSGITLSPLSAEIYVNNTLILTASISPADATDQAVIWTSSDETLASVDHDGLVTGLAIGGPVTITAESAGNDEISASCNITITPNPVTGLVITPSSAVITINDTLQLTAVVSPADATYQGVTWASSDETLATVDSEGVVTAKAIGGPVIITAESAVYPGVSAECEITIDPRHVTGVAVNPSSHTITVKDTLQLTAVVSPVDATYQGITWASSDETLATVDTDGLVTSIKAGTVTITAISADTPSVTGDCVITIDPLTECIVAESGSGTGARTTYTLLDGTMFTTVQTTEDSISSITFPTGISDLTTATITTPVIFAETETTYELWSTVYAWAINNGYTFSFNALCGSGDSGSIQQPAGGVTWYNAIVWCNALTEYFNANNEAAETDLVCVYYNDSDYTIPIRSTSDTSILTPYVYSGAAGNLDSSGCTATGFRLPGSKEWEYAARYRGTDSTNAILSGSIYYTTGASACGAWTYYNDTADSNSNSIADGDEATSEVAVCNLDNPAATAAVKTKAANALGLYDMSGNIFEWCFELSSTRRVYRGGSYYQILSLLQIGEESSYYPLTQYPWIGIRVVRNR